ncbi:MAG: Na+ dependent nucleoside transporter [Flavobacteriales bacterium]|nr:Na+ dependent nucleoside transporter [Flavobacteriales bacterium]
MDILRGLLGLLFLLGIAWVFSENRKAISWRLVGFALVGQLVLAVLILKAPFVKDLFEWVASLFRAISDFSNAGAQMIFGYELTNPGGSAGFVFATRVLPTIIFFSAVSSLLYYWGILQKIVYAFAWVMKRLLRVSGAESLAAAGNIFLGQTESPLLVKPYLDRMTRSEIMSLMSGGMATIAGSVLVSYIVFLGGDDPAEQLKFATHLLTASILSAPAAILAAKMIVPETDHFNDKLELSKDRMGANSLEAIANGTTDGIKLAVNVAGMLLVFTALIFGFNTGMSWLGDITGWNEWIAANTNFDGLSFQFIMGYICAPIAWMLGVSWEDAILVGQLLGEKTVLNEFLAYISLGEMKAAGSFAHDKSIIMATYILCGFANFASIGIQIGGIGSLAPTRKGLLSKLGMKALLAGTLACLFTAVIVGMIYQF